MFLVDCGVVCNMSGFNIIIVFDSSVENVYHIISCLLFLLNYFNILLCLLILLIEKFIQSMHCACLILMLPYSKKESYLKEG